MFPFQKHFFFQKYLLRSFAGKASIYWLMTTIWNIPDLICDQFTISSLLIFTIVLTNFWLNSICTLMTGLASYSFSALFSNNGCVNRFFSLNTADKRIELRLKHLKILNSFLSFLGSSVPHNYDILKESLSILSVFMTWSAIYFHDDCSQFFI